MARKTGRATTEDTTIARRRHRYRAFHFMRAKPGADLYRANFARSIMPSRFAIFLFAIDASDMGELSPVQIDRLTGRSNQVKDKGSTIEILSRTSRTTAKSRSVTKFRTRPS